MRRTRILAAAFAVTQEKALKIAGDLKGHSAALAAAAGRSVHHINPCPGGENSALLGRNKEIGQSAGKAGVVDRSCRARRAALRRCRRARDCRGAVPPGRARNPTSNSGCGCTEMVTPLPYRIPALGVNSELRKNLGTLGRCDHLILVAGGKGDCVTKPLERGVPRGNLIDVAPRCPSPFRTCARRRQARRR